MVHKIKSIAVISTALVVSLAGCHANPSSNQTASPTNAAASGQIPTPAANDADAQSSALMAAAEPFEGLTENAFVGDTVKLDDFIAKARISAAGAARLLAPPQAKVLASQVAAIDAARAGNNRADLAIAAVEAYRTLVSNVGTKLKVPKQVSLLDYAGFRFQADLKASPARWGDTVRTIDFADGQWQQISSKVGDATLRKDMSQALSDMRTASASKDAKLAMSASTRELDLVDGLESYFDKH